MSDIAGNKEIVRRFFGAIQAGDIAAIEALQAPDCTWWVVGSGAISRQAFTDAVKTMLLTATTRKVEIVGIIGEGDQVAVEMRSEMHFGDRIYANDYHDLLTIRNDLIVHGREFLDTARAAAFFGAHGG
jgi:uncharacterized protein